MQLCRASPQGDMRDFSSAGEIIPQISLASEDLSQLQIHSNLLSVRNRRRAGVGNRCGLSSRSVAADPLQSVLGRRI